MTSLLGRAGTMAATLSVFAVIGTGAALAAPSTAVVQSPAVVSASSAMYPYETFSTYAKCLEKAGAMHDSGKYGSGFRTTCIQERSGPKKGLTTLYINK